MAVVLGYGGLANTNGARNFSGKEESIDVGGEIESGYTGSGLASGLGMRNQKRRLLWWAFKRLEALWQN